MAVKSEIVPTGLQTTLEIPEAFILNETTSRLCLRISETPLLPFPLAL